MRKIVIGGGASGLMAAYSAASCGHQVLLLEKNNKLGKKIYITGKGRCNLTNDCPPDEFLSNVVHGEKFLRGAIYRFPPSGMMSLLERCGLPLKTERGNRVFPVSDHASDVTKTLERACRSLGVEIGTEREVTSLLIESGRVRGVIADGEELEADCVIVATGGRSYPSTGSTGDGYRFASEAGHTVTACVPSLVGIACKGEFSAVQGISVKNAVLTAACRGKTVFSELGEFLFTHYGVSGPLVLSLSARINRLPLSEVTLSVDFKPALDASALDRRLVRDLAERSNEQMKNVMRGLLPSGLGTLVLQAAHIPPQKQANAVTKEERVRLAASLKGFVLRPASLRGFEEAVVTSGGVSLREVDPKTMQSLLVKGLYFCGEVLDVDAYTGGFNLQIAFSTGFVAGIGDDSAD